MRSEYLAWFRYDVGISNVEWMLCMAHKTEQIIVWHMKINLV